MISLHILYDVTSHSLKADPVIDGLLQPVRESPQAPGFPRVFGLMTYDSTPEGTTPPCTWYKLCQKTPGGIVI